METALTLDIKPGDVVSLDKGAVKIEVVHKSGKLARLRFVAPKETEIKLIKAEVNE
jgi:pyruvate kinase